MGIVGEAHNMKIVGKGEEVIVLSHGFGTDQSVWKHLVPHLVEDYKVVLYDNMGAGTTNPDYFDSLRYSTIDGFASDLIAVLEEVGVKEPCVFVGHSFACMVGALASIACPHIFSKLIMLSATPRLLNGEDYFGGFNQEDLGQIYEGMRSNYESWCSGFAPLIVGADMDTIAAQEFCRTLFNMRPDITLSLAPVIFQSDMRHILPLVTVPCHILQSKKDMAVPLMVSEYLHQNISGRSIVEIMPVGGHLPQLSSPDVVIPVILKHIRGDIN